MNINAAFPQFYIDTEYDTYSDREELKRLGFKWDPDKKAWWHKDKAERDAAYAWLLLHDAEDWCDPGPPWND